RTRSADHLVHGPEFGSPVRQIWAKLSLALHLGSGSRAVRRPSFYLWNGRIVRHRPFDRGARERRHRGLSGGALSAGPISPDLLPGAATGRNTVGGIRPLGHICACPASARGRLPVDTVAVRVSADIQGKSEWIGPAHCRADTVDYDHSH